MVYRTYVKVAGCSLSPENAAGRRHDGIDALAQQGLTDGMIDGLGWLPKDPAIGSHTVRGAPNVQHLSYVTGNITLMTPDCLRHSVVQAVNEPKQSH
jgi:hypothetical protein